MGTDEAVKITVLVIVWGLIIGLFALLVWLTGHDD